MPLFCKERQVKLYCCLKNGWKVFYCCASVNCQQIEATQNKGDLEQAKGQHLTVRPLSYGETCMAYPATHTPYFVTQYKKENLDI